jgi:hypothetical protein
MPVGANEMTLGVILAPSEYSIILGFCVFFSTTATHEFVVPKSIPIICFFLKKP